MVLAAGTLFAVNGTVSRLVLRAGFDETQLTTVRATGAFLGLMVIALATRPRTLALTRRELPVLVAYGLAGFFFTPLLYFVSISRLGVGIGLLFEYTAPLLIALWARFVQRQEVRRRLWTGLVLSLLGLAAVANVWGGGDRRLDPVGVAAGLGAAALLAVYFLVGEKGVRRRDTVSLTGWAFGVAALAGAVVRPWWNFSWSTLSERSDGWPVWLLCCYVVIGGSIMSYLLIAGALRHLPATSVSIVAMIEPVIASAVAWVVLREHLSVVQIAGGALILAGVALAETARTRQPDAPEVPVT